MEPSSPSQTIVYHYFDTSIQTIWNIISDVTKSYHLLHQKKTHFHSEPIFHLYNNSKESGSIFSFVFLLTHLIYFKVEKNIETDYWCHYQLIAYLTTLSSPLFQMQTSLYYINENRCLLTMTFTQYINYQFFFDQIIRKFSLFNSIENILQSNEQYKLHIGNIGIKCPFNLMVSLLLDLKTYQKNVPLLCDEIDYEGQVLHEGTIMTAKFYKGNDKEKTYTLITMKIVSIVVVDNHFSLRIETIDETQGVPYQEMEYTLWKVNEGHSYFIIKHKFKEALPQSILNSYTQRKEKLLQKTKEWSEKLSFEFA